jgi:hypothetical protein
MSEPNRAPASGEKDQLPAMAGETIDVQLQESDLAALDRYMAAARLSSRPEAIRMVVSDWLTAHRYTEPRSAGHPPPQGPATDAIKAMDTAIAAHRAKNK